MAKRNTLADDLVPIVQKQLQTCWSFKQPRVRTIQKFRRLYNTEVLPKLRQQFNVPLPVFAGMVDTLQADLDDKLIIKFKHKDPADWKAIEKVNAAITQEGESSRPDAQWDDKLQAYRFEKLLTGRGVLKFTASSVDGYSSALTVPTFEDFFFEPMGGGDLENHLFAGEQNIWRTRGQLEKGVSDGLYEKTQVKQLLETEGHNWKMAGVWDSHFDVGNRFRPLGLSPESHNYVGEDVFNLVEWVLEYKGRRWYMLLEPFTGTWIRFDKNENICSADYFPWMSSASHKDLKNFASKSFADDLYPIADSVITLFNQDLTNRQKRLLNARAYDRQMFKDVGKLDEAQYRPDALVPVDTMNGTRRIAEGIYEFKTPEVTGTVDLIDWLQRDAGKALGVSEMQQGANQPASKKVGVAYAEMAHISKRLAFKSKPFLQIGQQLGTRFFASLKDYMKQPMAIELLGETGMEWDVLKRVDLHMTKPFEITVSSQMQRNDMNETENAQKMRAFELTGGSPHVNTRVRDELIFREIGGFSEHDITLLLDPTADTNKETLAEVSAAIQDIVLRSKKPKTNWNADRYFLKRLLEFAKKHRDTLPEKKFKLLMEYYQEHVPIVEENLASEAQAAVQEEARMMNAEGMSATSGAPANPVARPVAGPQSPNRIPAI